MLLINYLKFTEYKYHETILYAAGSDKWWLMNRNSVKTSMF